MQRRTLLGLLATTAIPGSIATEGAVTDCEARIVAEELDVYRDCGPDQLYGTATVERLDCADPISARVKYASERRGFIGLEEHRAPMSRADDEPDGSTVSFEVSTSVEGYSPRDFSVQVRTRGLVVDERSPTVPEHSNEHSCG